ncbi:MAG: PLDc N-terminal domain-containing protein [Ferruginibacter sp.]
MENIFSLFTEYYYIVLILQGICAFHCVRKGNQGKWIWLIVFLPLVGCLAYIFTEIFTRHEMEQVQSGMSTVFNPSGKIKKLQNNLAFRDTFDNRLALADAYLEAGQVDPAIELYEGSLTGTFAAHEHGNMQLIKAYYEKRRYEEVVTTGKKVYALPQFKRSRAQTLYAAALGFTGRNEEAEKEFISMNGKFSNYESRYQYGRYMMRNNRMDEAKKLFRDILNEASHLDSVQKRHNKVWFAKVKEELKNVEATAG